MLLRYKKGRSITGIFLILLLSKLNDDYKRILYAKKCHFEPFEEKAGARPPGPGADLGGRRGCGPPFC